MTAYGKVRLSLGLATEDAAGNKDKGLSNESSRFGFKGSEDLGNGMSAIYQIELGYNADGDGGPVSNRIGMAGLKGDFGTVALGNMWTPSYTLVRGAHDPFNSVGGNVQTGNFPAGFRVDDAVAYMNKFGNVSFAAAIVPSNGGNATDSEADSLMDHMDLAISVPVGPVTLGVAMGQTNADVSANEKSTSAVDIGWKSGDLGLNVGLFQTDLADDWMAITASFQAFTVQFEDDGTDNQTSLGYVHKLSKKTSLFAELTSGDIADDETNVGIHVNF
jgi:predicted porin